MQKRQLGRSDLAVSAMCLGTMTFGAQTSADDAFTQMDMALDAGINFFDTAEMYAVPPRAETQGETERIIGRWLQARQSRARVVIATKVAGPAPGMPWIRGGASALVRAQIIEACDDSLKRLQTDYIDLYQTHWPQRPVNSFGTLDFPAARVTAREGDVIDETLDTMGDLIRAGKIRHVGLSNETPWGVMRHLQAANDSRPRVVSIQNPYNFLNRSFEVGLSEIALQENVGLLAYAPLAAGTLTGKYLGGQMPPGSRRAHDHRVSRYARPLEDETVRGYLEIARAHGLDPVHMAIAFVTQRPFVTANIIGATTVEQLRHDLGAVDCVLSADVLRDIHALHDRHPNPCP